MTYVSCYTLAIYKPLRHVKKHLDRQQQTINDAVSAMQAPIR